MTTPATPGALNRYMCDPKSVEHYVSCANEKDPADLFYLAADVERVLEQVVVMLEEHSMVLHCWMNTYAPEMCDAEEVRKARQYIFDQGGVLAFIAHQRAEAQVLLATLKGRP